MAQRPLLPLHSRNIAATFLSRFDAAAYSGRRKKTTRLPRFLGIQGIVEAVMNLYRWSFAGFGLILMLGIAGCGIASHVDCDQVAQQQRSGTSAMRRSLSKLGIASPMCKRARRPDRQVDARRRITIKMRRTCRRFRTSASAAARFTRSYSRSDSTTRRVQRSPDTTKGLREAIF